VAVEWPAVWPVEPSPPESPGRRLLIRSVAVLALGATLAYLLWRIGATLAGANPWLAALFLVLELHAFAGLALATFDLWDVDAARPRPDRGTDFRIAVLIPTRDEPREVLLPTIAAAVALRPAHETWILDDGDRPWLQALARRIGANYRGREAGPGESWATQVNEILPELDVDLVAFLDSDHIATAEFLHRTTGYFTDPRVALVQTPQEFYAESLARFGSTAAEAEHELYRRSVSAGRNRHGAALWFGTNAVLRRSALLDIGGVAHSCATEDTQTTLRLHRQGWRTRFHDEVLARGVSPVDATQYLSQRERRGIGALQLLRYENPATVAGLTASQRVSYLSNLLGWLEPWRMLGYLLLPMLVVATGAVPLVAPAWVFLPAFAVVAVLQRLALRLLARGPAAGWLATLFGVIGLPAALRAVVGRRGFGARHTVPVELVVLTLATLLSLAFWVVSAAGLTPVRYPVGWIAAGAAVWLVVNLALLVTAMRRIAAARSAAERRAGVRFEVHGHAVVNGRLARLHDLSLTGASLRVHVPPAPGQEIMLGLTVDGSVLQLPAVVRTARGLAERTVPGHWTQIGVEFTDLSDTVAARLALSLFRTGMTTRLVDTNSPRS